VCRTADFCYLMIAFKSVNHLCKGISLMLLTELYAVTYNNSIYTVSRKKGATDFFAVTSTNIDDFIIFSAQLHKRMPKSLA